MVTSGKMNMRVDNKEARETLSLGLLLLEFKDAVREEDGVRVLQCWNFFPLFFRVTGHKNY